MTFNKKDRIDNYTVVFPHKEGSYAETYRVKDADGKNRFLKLINCSRLSRWQTDEEGGLIEVAIAKQLQHANLCQFVDDGSLMLNGSMYAYFVTEFVSGETLSKYIVRSGCLDVYSIKQVAKAVLSALDYLHTLPVPILHNEITVQNILIDLVGGFKRLKLIDFGHACFINQQVGKPDLNELNAFYLAPERFSGVCSVQTDLYAVGALMYLLLYERLPWFIDMARVSGDDRVEAILAAREKELDTPDIQMMELDEQLVNTIVKALSQDAEDRFLSAKEFMQAIDGAVRIPRQSTKRRILSSVAEKKTAASKPTNIAKGPGFAAIAGMDDLKAKLREEVIEPLHNPEEYRKYGITIPNGMLLYGPPGCGKTFFAKHFAEEVGFNFMLVTPASLKSRYVNATQENIAKLFKEAAENAPTIIFIDEMNEIVPDRESNVHEMSKSAVNEMLAQMDRTGEQGVFVIGATNYPHMIDKAILRTGRLDRKYYVGPPDHAGRKALFELYLKNRPYDFGLDYEALAQLTEYYVSSDIATIVNDAARAALKAHSRITMALLQDAVRACKPSLNRSELDRYEAIRVEVDGEAPPKPEQETPRRKIGFKPNE